MIVEVCHLFHEASYEQGLTGGVVSSVEQMSIYFNFHLYSGISSVKTRMFDRRLYERPLQGVGINLSNTREGKCVGPEVALLAANYRLAESN